MSNLDCHSRLLNTRRRQPCSFTSAAIESLGGRWHFRRGSYRLFLMGPLRRYVNGLSRLSARPCRNRLRVERYQERSLSVSGGWRGGFPARGWRAQLRMGEDRRIVVHGTGWARNLYRSRSAAHQQPRLQPRPGAGSGANLPAAFGVLGSDRGEPEIQLLQIACH
jgi:hypothetical protein